jgi:hypothetical protein
VKHNIVRFWSCLLFIPLAIATAGCATRSAPDLHGRWHAVNRYAAQTQEIPLHKAYLFQPSPIDGTLKAMLVRWARDAKLTLSYEHPSDFTLYTPVARIRTDDLQQAVSMLTAAYAGQRVQVTAEQGRIVVRPVNAVPTMPDTASIAAPGG